MTPDPSASLGSAGARSGGARSADARPPVDAGREHPHPLADHYRRFRVADRLLLTGHSHQAWPDCAARGQARAFDDAALHVDEKWSRAFERARVVEAGFARWLDDATGTMTLASNTHDLLIRWLSALPLRQRPRLVTTDGEFHSIRRQLERLEEEGVEVVRVPVEVSGDSSSGAETLAERLAAAVDDRAAAVLVSSVLFASGQRVPGLRQVAERAAHHGVEVLVDTYHQLGAVPFSLPEEGLDGAFVVGGGYKYLQMGEGNCFLRVPPGRDLRPVVTGWFAEFETLSGPVGGVGYGPGAAAFIGATYDPTSQYRAAEVVEFFDQQGLDAPHLRAVSQRQVAILADAFDGLDLDPSQIARPNVPLDRLGGFLTLRAAQAVDFAAALRERGVRVDARGDALRFGPAPYLSDRQLRDAIAALVGVV